MVVENSQANHSLTDDLNTQTVVLISLVTVIVLTIDIALIARNIREFNLLLNLLFRISIF